MTGKGPTLPETTKTTAEIKRLFPRREREGANRDVTPAQIGSDLALSTKHRDLVSHVMQGPGKLPDRGLDTTKADRHRDIDECDFHFSPSSLS